MKTVFPTLLFASLIIMVVSHETTAQTSVSEQGVTSSGVERALLKKEGMTDEDVLLYEQLKSSYLGALYPNVDPSWLLGLHAKRVGDQKEYNRYLEIIVQRNIQQVNDETEFAQDVHNKAQELYPDQPSIFNLVKSQQGFARAHAKKDQRQNALYQMAEASTEPVRFVVRPACGATCVSKAKQHIQTLIKNGGALDFIFDGFTKDQITSWARDQIELDPDLTHTNKVGLSVLRQGDPLALHQWSAEETSQGFFIE